MKRFAILFTLCVAACPPVPAPAMDAGAADGPCDPAGVTQARIIRDPVTGKALVVPCEAGK